MNATDKPQLVFFCELEAAPLKELFSDGSKIATLKSMNAGVSLGILDLSPERADVVRKLNSEGIPVTAWLLLPKDQGYWFNANNFLQAAAFYGKFKTWTAQNSLGWERIGIDIEPDLREMQKLMTDRKAFFSGILSKVFNRSRARKAQNAYIQLIMQMHIDGYPVESYQFPFILDERQAGSTLLQRTFGIVDLPVDREVLMLYSSFTGAAATGVLWVYGREAQGIGLGSTGGGVEIPGTPGLPELSWPELQRDLLLSIQNSPWLYVFSLEGCIKQNMLEKIAKLDWTQPVTLPIQTSRNVKLARTAGRAVLWLSAHPWVIGLGVVGLVFRRRRTQRTCEKRSMRGCC
jgi:hypothetical protein